MPFPAAQTCFRLGICIADAISIPLWLRVARWRPTLRSLRSYDPDLRQFRGGAGNQAATVEPGGQWNHGGIGGGVGEQAISRSPEFFWRSRLSNRNWRCPWLLADALGSQRLAATARFRLELLFSPWQFCWRRPNMFFPDGWALSRCALRLSRVHTGREFSAGSPAHAMLGKILVAVIVMLVAAIGWRVRRAAHDSAAFGVDDWRWSSPRRS